jgi:hypothetical protein
MPFRLGRSGKCTSFRGCAPRVGLFFTIEPRQDTASLDGAGVGGNIDLRRILDKI